MTRRFTLLFLIVVFLNGCQNYTSGLQQSLARADETAALTTLRAIALAERTYSLTNSGEYGTLNQLVDGGFLEPRYAGEKAVKDYLITLTVIPKAPGAPEGSYSCNADPERAGERAGRHMYIDSTSAGIHVNDTQPATASDKVMD
jgi:Tfp pilus assembly protein PilE